eukprot:SAG31_NODE_4722_length_3007_cov_2.155089_1_plen_564_part_00
MEAEPASVATTTTAFTYSELFAGIGGFRVGLDALGGRSVFASEVDAEACKVYKANFADEPQGDVTEIETANIPPHDVLTAGFPCQSFSAAGNQGGFSDPRGMLFREVVRVLKHVQPKAFMLENVANLARMNQGALLKQICSELDGAGYDVQWRLLNSRVVLPQQRARIYLVGLRKRLNLSRSFRWPELPVLDTCLRDVLECSLVDDDPEHVLTEQQWAQLQESPDWRRDPSFRLANLDGAASTLISGYRQGHSLRSEFVWRHAEHREGVDGVSHSRPRFFTLVECARLQGFPSNFRLGADSLHARNKGRGYAQLGNAVCPVIVAAVGAAILEALGTTLAIPETLASELSPRMPSLHQPIVDRAHSAVALHLLLNALPTTAVLPRAGKEGLQAQCCDFLARRTGSPVPWVGYGGCFSPADAAYAASSLTSCSMVAKLLALQMLGHFTHLENEGFEEGVGTCSTIASAGLLPALIACFRAEEETEIQRLAVVVVCCMSRNKVGRLALLKQENCKAALDRLHSLKDGSTIQVKDSGSKIILGGFRRETPTERLSRQAREALSNLFY